MSSELTEIHLKSWRGGQVQAERLSAALLHLEGFESVDPQHPLGGPDGKKDILCKRAGKCWLAAAYFPPTEPSWTEIKKKFGDDFSGVSSNGASGFVFFVNQHVSVGERADLIAITEPIETEIYHIERIGGLLNSPKGCGIRLEYLKIAMTEAEQWAFWNEMNSDVAERLKETQTQIKSFDQKLDDLLERSMAIQRDLRAQPSSFLVDPMKGLQEVPTASLSVEILLWIHRIVTERDTANRDGRGRFRSIQVWIGKKDSTPETAGHIPSAPERIIPELRELIDWWRQLHPRLRDLNKNEVVGNLAVFHHRLLAVHPFLDGNGRVARVLLDQAADELLGMRVGPEFSVDLNGYYSALKAADAGEYRPLQRLILASLQ